MRLVQCIQIGIAFLFIATILTVIKRYSGNVGFYEDLDIQILDKTIEKETNFCEQKYGNVTIFVATDNLTLTKTTYKEAISSLTCYAKRRGYKLIIIDVFQDELTQESCSKLKSVLFLRHCASAVYLSTTDWLFVLDADNGVINFDHCIEEYIRPELDIIHSERFHNGEITASNYIAKSSQYSYNYLMQWSQYENYEPRFVNYDNGALHYHLLNSLQLDWVSNNTLAQCEQMGWKNSSSGYQFVGCVKKALKGKRNFKHIKIYRRGLGFARDSWITNHKWSEFDFILHAMKHPDNVHFETEIDVEQCSVKEWRLPVKNSLKLSVKDMVPLMRKADLVSVRKAPQSLLDSADVSNCWPNCPEDVE